MTVETCYNNCHSPPRHQTCEWHPPLPEQAVSARVPMGAIIWAPLRESTGGREKREKKKKKKQDKKGEKGVGVNTEEIDIQLIFA